MSSIQNNYIKTLKAINKLRKKHYFLAVVFVVAVFFIVSHDFFLLENKEIKGNKINKLCIKDNCFDVEVADTLEKRETGLMFREQLASNSGMLFIFGKEDVYNFWMKNTLIPLDIIWIDKNNEIIFIKENVQPCKTEQCETFGPNEKALYILEINGGLAKEIGLKVGNEVKYK